MDRNNCNIRAMNRAAHINAAGNGESDLVGKPLGLKIGHKFVHHGLYQSGCISTCTVAVHPSLGMDNVADTRSDATHLEPSFGKVLPERFDLLLIGYEELNIVSRGIAEESPAVLVCQIAMLTDRGS